MQWADVIKNALLELGVRSLDDEIPDSEQDFAFGRLRSMLDSWSNERLLVFQTHRDVFNGDSEKIDFKIGDHEDADVRTERPLFIESVTISRNNVIDVGLNERSSSLISDGRTLSVVGSPRNFSYETGWPMGLLRFDAKPWTTDVITVTSSKSFPLPALVTDEVNLPPDYERVIEKNLAVDIAPVFGIERLNPLTLKEAMRGKSRLRAQNVQPMEASLDSALQGGAGGSLSDRRTDLRHPNI